MRAPLLRLAYCNAQQQHHSTALHSTTVTRDETSHQPHDYSPPLFPPRRALLSTPNAARTPSPLSRPLTQSQSISPSHCLVQKASEIEQSLPGAGLVQAKDRQFPHQPASQLALQDLAAFPMGGAMRQLLSFLGAINGRPTPGRRRTTTLRRRLVRDGGAEGQDELRARGQECFLWHA